MKQTKIVATISDRRCDQEFIRKLFFAGMNVVRMNTAHAPEEGMKEIIRNVRAVSSHIALMIDQGTGNKNHQCCRTHSI